MGCVGCCDGEHGRGREVGVVGCLPWCAMVCHGVPWCAMVCHGVPWCAMVRSTWQAKKKSKGGPRSKSADVAGKVSRELALHALCSCSVPMPCPRALQVRGKLTNDGAAKLSEEARRMEQNRILRHITEEEFQRETERRMMLATIANPQKRLMLHRCKDACDEMGWDGMGSDGIGWDRTGWHGMAWHGTAWHGMGWDVMGCDGMGSAGMGWDWVWCDDLCFGGISRSSELLPQRK